MRYGMFLRGAVGVLLVASGVGCDKWEEESLTPEVEQQGFISLQEVAQLLSAVPLEREQVLEVQEATGSSASSASGGWYRVRSGDTLEKIARRHGTTVRRLCQLNGISQNKTIREGQKLKVK